jgi:hypothetical protein
MHQDEVVDPASGLEHQGAKRGDDGIDGGVKLHQMSYRQCPARGFVALL